jgi:phytoene dehydrogenase-like protein
MQGKIMPEFDAVVVGSGPNGLAAAITLARAGWSVVIYEAKERIGGGARTEELTLPGYLHDVCSAIHPLGIASPFFRSMPLDQYGVEWVHPDAPLAHPLDDEPPALLEKSLDETGKTLGVDAESYKSLMQPFVEHWQKLFDDILGPLPIPPRYPFLMARFGLSALRSTKGLVNSLFKDRKAKAMFAGMAAHSFIPLDHIPTASFGMVLGILGHAVGWPLPKGGTQSLIKAMAAYFESMGGKIVTGSPVINVDDLPTSRAVLFDVTPRQLLGIAAHRFPDGYRRKLEAYRYGPGIFKIDWALDGPVPWKWAECARGGTVHLGGTFEEIASAERDAWEGRIPEKPFVLFAQQSLFDQTRAPDGKQTGWAYCHVPNGSSVDMTERIENQIERFAPGFRERILARHTFNTVEYQAYNSNYVGGDINGGVQDIWQLFTRPTFRRVPYSTPDKQIYICSSSTPPGGGVHGMCGYFAAKAALKDHMK